MSVCALCVHTFVWLSNVSFIEQNVPGISLFQLLKRNSLPLLSVFVIVNGRSLSLRTIVQQKKDFEGVNMVFRKLWSAFQIFWHVAGFYI